MGHKPGRAGGCYISNQAIGTSSEWRRRLPRQDKQPPKSYCCTGAAHHYRGSGGDHTHCGQPSRCPTRRAQLQRAHHRPRCSSTSSLSCCRCAAVAARRSASRSKISACSSACSSSHAGLLSCCCCCCCCTCCTLPPAAAAWLARQAASRCARSDLQSGSRTMLRKSADSGPSSWLRCQRHSAGRGLACRQAVGQGKGARHAGGQADSGPTRPHCSLWPGALAACALPQLHTLQQPLPWTIPSHGACRGFGCPSPHLRVWRRAGRVCHGQRKAPGRPSTWAAAAKGRRGGEGRLQVPRRQQEQGMKSQRAGVAARGRCGCWIETCSHAHHAHIRCWRRK